MFNLTAKKAEQKANIVANGIDAEAKTGINTLKGTLETLNQFDIIEGQLNVLEQAVLASGDTASSELLKGMRTLMDSIQKNTQSSIKRGIESFETIRVQTDVIQKEV